MSRLHVLSLAAASLAVSILSAVPTASPANASSGAAPAHAARPSCHGKVATIVGTRRDDKLRGTRRADVIVGGGGNDRIQGFAGNDTICGNIGADDLFGGAGHDVLLGGRDQAQTDPELDEYWSDVLQGGPGNDLIDPGPHTRSHLPDTISFNKARRGVVVRLPKGSATGEGRDRLRLHSSRIAVLGSVHDDVIRGGQRHEVLMGSRGDDRISGAGGSDELYDDASWLRGYGYNWVPRDDPDDVDVLAGGPRGDGLEGDRHDIAFGGAGSDSVRGGRIQRGGPGHDFLNSLIDATQPRRRVIDGGAGRDELEFNVEKGLGALRTDLRSGRARLEAAGASFRFADVEELWLVNHRTPWTIFGTDKSEQFDGGGRMTIRAGGGNDSIDSWDFDDHIDGGAGRDTAWTGEGDDTCISVERIRNPNCHPPR